MISTSEVDVSTYVKVYGDVPFKCVPTDDGGVELGFGRADLVLTRKAAERVHAQLGTTLAALRESDAEHG
ncbi:hypothetical protein [Saccharothrix coeruleofusca]|uniref:Uncharacterized protein n=1 Tax=Saccharothrix coeruleofusca TaxID=33919 RepID=A0A918AT51_9PSEU|nr:hypothetical protein [Saccharothrix coeruleofusca]GGP80122.1 hypothetical protein GCM10010185_62430 [Saccharothrix coeruleofusca]